MKISVVKLLFRPFEYVSEFKALTIGIAAIALSGLLNVFSGTHFDGVLDVHFGDSKSYSYLFLLEGVINWISFSVLLFVSGKIFSPSSIRFIDVFGTIAMARWPLFIVAILSLVIPHQTVDQFIMAKAININAPVVVEMYEIVLFIILSLVMILVAIWVIILMYRAYSVSCNLKGAKGVWSFIVALLIAEVISKYLIYLLA
jgi:hypothetical protein